jgi:hypothetical protein
MYREDGPDVDDADLMVAATPSPLLPVLHKPLTRRGAEMDKDLLDGLEAVGFALDFGPDDAGMAVKVLYGGEGSYYVDVGASQLIVDGKVKVKQGVDIERFNTEGVIMADGTFLPADVVVMATGYSGMLSGSRSVIGDIADKCLPVFSLGEDGERTAVWRPSGHDGLWFMAGTIQIARHYSRLLALQIKAIEEGILDPEPVADQTVMPLI